MDANPALLAHFPRLASQPAPLLIRHPRRLPRAVYPGFLDPPARVLGRRRGATCSGRAGAGRRLSPGRVRAIDDAPVHAVRPKSIGIASAVVLGLTSVLLFAFGVNLLYLTIRAIRLPKPLPRPLALDDEPFVCVQVPIYNERYVAERVIDAVCALDWPRDRLQVQVLDDSDDDTTNIAGRARRPLAAESRGSSM